MLLLITPFQSAAEADVKKIPLLLSVFFFVLHGVWGFQIGDRFFEIGFDAGINFSNDFLSASDIFQEVFILDLDKLENGFHMKAGADVNPFYFNFNSKKGWGFGLSTKMQATGFFDLSGQMLTLSENMNDSGNSEINGALFAEAAIPVHFNIKKLKLNVRPAVFYPVFYATSDITYIFNETTEGTVFNLGYDVNLYTAMSEEMIITAMPGVDLSIGVEFPISEALGISGLLFFLNFDIGLELSSIPVAAGTMTDFIKMKGNIGGDEPVSLFGEDADLENFFDLGEAEYLSKRTAVRRPFKAFIYAAWRPFGNSLLTLTPSAGFAISQNSNKKFFMEGGIKGCLNIGNLFLLTLGTGYYDRYWNQSINIALNFRAVEFNIAAALCAPDFIKSFDGSGFSLNAGIKFGW